MRFTPHLPGDIEQHPDLAALEVLRAVADYARAIAIAACPELNSVEHEQPSDLGEKAVSVAALLDVIDELCKAIQAVEDADRIQRRLIDDNLSF